MRYRLPLNKLFTLGIAVLALLTGTAARAQACSCLPSTVSSSYNQHTDVISGRVMATATVADEQLYLFRVSRPFKGCLTRGEYVVLTTPNSSAACGVNLAVGRSYLINGISQPSIFGPTLAINLCAYNVRTVHLSAEDREFLNGRTVCCGDECGCADGSEPVNCLVNPCEVAPPCAAGECVANYCGGCNAEFFDEAGNQVCKPGACEYDSDCPSGNWCRGTDEGTTECVPFATAGESCEGFVMASMFERCEPGLTCDFSEPTQDIPGVCRTPCASYSDCGAEEYCASDSLCHEDGACEVKRDCNIKGNSFPHIMCVGHGICADGQCGWECAAEPG